MFYKNIIAVGAFVAALTGTMASAQAETLFEALTSAYKNNPNITAALLDVKSAAENIALAKAGKLPTIGMSSSFSSTYTPDGAQSDNAQQWQVGGSYSQTIFDNFKTDAEVEGARAGVEVAQQTLRNTEQNVLLSAAQAYMDVVTYRQLVSLRQSNVDFYQAQVGSSEDRLEIGEGTRIDVSQARARLAQGVAAYTSAVNSLKTSEASYARWVGHKPGNLSDNFNFSGRLPTSIDSAIATGLDQHPAILTAQAAIRAAASGVDSAKASFGPSLSLNGSAGISGAMSNRTGGAFSTQPSASVSLQLTVPLYAGGALGASVRKANIDQIKSEVDSLSASDQVTEAVISSWTALQTATAQIESANSAVESGQLALEGIIQERDVGQRTTLDVLDSQAELTTAREGLINARSTRVVASFGLLSATGRLSAAELGLPVEIKTADPYIQKVEDVWQELRSIED